MKKLRVVLLLFIAIGLYAQQVDPNMILEKVKSKIDKVEDYSVKANVKVDVEFLKVPETDATIYFKKPDKVKMESDGFALLPRQGFNFSPAMLLQHEYTAVFAKNDTIDNNAVYLIKILPLSDSTEVILSNLWVDTDEYLVRKIETTTKKSGTITIELKYGSESSYALPSELKITFKIEGMKLPDDMSGEAETENKSWRDKSMSGTVTVKYSDYKVNQGLSDDFFEEKE